MSHTPGPWEVVADPVRHYIIVSRPAGNKIVAQPPAGGILGAEDARLIAAAPNLLDIAEKYIALCTHCGLFQEAEDAKLLVARVRVGE